MSDNYPLVRLGRASTAERRPNIGLTARNEYPVKPGYEYDAFIPKPRNVRIVMHKNTDERITVNGVRRIVEETLPQTANLAPLLRRSSQYDTCREVWNFVKNHFRYREDDPNEEQVREPAASWAVRSEYALPVGDDLTEVGIDCDCMTVFISSLLVNLGISHVYRIAEYNPEMGPQHIYPVAMLGNRKVIMDCVIDSFDKEHCKTCVGFIPTNFPGPFGQRISGPGTDTGDGLPAGLEDIGGILASGDKDAIMEKLKGQAQEYIKTKGKEELINGLWNVVSGHIDGADPEIQAIAGTAGAIAAGAVCAILLTPASAPLCATGGQLIFSTIAGLITSLFNKDKLSPFDQEVSDWVKGLDSIPDAEARVFLSGGTLTNNRYDIIRLVNKLTHDLTPIAQLYELYKCYLTDYVKLQNYKGWEHNKFSKQMRHFAFITLYGGARCLSSFKNEPCPGGWKPDYKKEGDTTDWIIASILDSKNVFHYGFPGKLFDVIVNRDNRELVECIRQNPQGMFLLKALNDGVRDFKGLTDYAANNEREFNKVIAELIDDVKAGKLDSNSSNLNNTLATFTGAAVAATGAFILKS